jgi:uncharacterized membrane protein YozB (DUF420 family)
MARIRRTTGQARAEVAVSTLFLASSVTDHAQVGSRPDDFIRPARIARRTRPFWLYVSVTGVIVSGMLDRGRP